MRRKFLIYFQSGIHLFLLISVFTGILFSSGEGLQLFPFPVSFENIENKSFYPQDDSNNSYAKTTHNFTNNSLSGKTNLKKNTKSENILGGIATNDLPLKKSFVSFSKANQVVIQFFYSSVYKVSTPSRAPPKI